RFSRVPRHAGAAARHRQPRARRAARRRAPRGGGRPAADHPCRLRSEGLGSRMNERPAIYVFQGEEAYWLAHVPVLRGCIASGTTRDQAIANARRAFRAYLELLDTRGVSIEHWKDLDPNTFEVRDMPSDRIVPEDVGPVEEHGLRDFVDPFE